MKLNKKNKEISVLKENIKKIENELKCKMNLMKSNSESSIY